jgi:hypothetical protein
MHLPQQQQPCVGGLQTGLGLQGVLPRKKPPRPAQIDWLVEAHPPGRQHAPYCEAELHVVGVQVVPVPCHSPPLKLQSHESCGMQVPLGKQHAPLWHGGGGWGQGFGEQVVDETCTHPFGQGTIAWQFPVAGSQHTPVAAPQDVGVQVVPAAGVPPPLMQRRVTASVQPLGQQHGTIVKFGPHAAVAHGTFASHVPPTCRHAVWTAG